MRFAVADIDVDRGMRRELTQAQWLLLENIKAGRVGWVTQTGRHKPHAYYIGSTKRQPSADIEALLAMDLIELPHRLDTYFNIRTKQPI